MTAPSPLSYQGSTVIGVRSWNQFCACTKPCTFGDSARGLRSCTTKIISACSDSYSCSLVSSASRFSASNSSKICLTSVSASGVPKWPQLLPAGDQYACATGFTIALTGSSSAREAFMPSTFGYFGTPERDTSKSAFQSITLSVTWKPASSSCCLTSSFMGNDCICPEPEVEIAKAILHGRQFASFNSACAFSLSNL